MKNSLLKILVAIALIANISAISYAKAKTYVIKPSSPVVTESLKPIIKDYREGNYTQSMVKLEELVQKEPDNTYANYYLALTYTRLGKKDKAKEYYTNVVNMNTNMSLRYYSEKALACLDDPMSAQCINISSTNQASKAMTAKADEEEDDITKFIKSGKMIHPAAADAITKERMERKIQAEEYLRKHQENNINDLESALPTKEEIIAAYNTLSKAGLNPFDTSINQYDLAYKTDLMTASDFDLYSDFFDSNQQAAQMILLNQLTQSQNALNYGI